MIFGSPVKAATSYLTWLVVGFVATAVLAVGIYIMKLNSDIETLREDNIVLSTKLKSAQDQVIELGEELARTNRIIELNKSIQKGAETIIGEQKKQLAAWELKYNDISKRMPTRLPDEKVCKETVDEQSNSSLRIQLIWELYCTHGDSTECQPEIKKE